MTYDQLSTEVQAQGLEIQGSLHPRHSPVADLLGGSLILLGTAGAFWPAFTASPEHHDGSPDPVDRWSLRVIGSLAQRFAASAHFPFGGPPYTPFVNWALASGRTFISPSQLMVQDQVGLMISFRGALHFAEEIDIPPPLRGPSPCDACADKPCLTTCLVSAIVDGGPYQLAACHQHLDRAEGATCMAQGCLARRACPLSQGANRDFLQSSHHMRYFHTI